VVFHKTFSEKITKLKKSQAVNSSIWVAVGMMGNQGIRLASNIMVTRLLVPEYFGMMAIVYSIVGFFAMMSDVGLVPSVINSKRDKEADYMSTVWTLQFLSALLLAVLLLMSAYPVSYIYHEPLLFPLLAAVALTSIISGLNSTALVLEKKYLRQKKLVLSQLCTQIFSSSVMIIVAYYTQSVWSLVAGNAVGAVVTLAYSYVIFSPHHSVFKLEAKAVKNVIGFGKWILLSSILSYAGSRSRPVIMGLWVGFKQLGIYSVAASLATVVEAIVDSLASKILHPKYRQYIEANNFEAIRKLRRKFIYLFLPITMIVALFGEHLVGILYDDRYQEAGAILQILAVGRIGTLFVLVTKPILIAMGDSKGLSASQGVTAVMSVILLVTAGTMSGFHAMVLAAALIPFVDFIAVSFVLKKHSFNYVLNDVFIMLTSIILIIIAWHYLASNSFKIITDLFASTQLILIDEIIDVFLLKINYMGEE